MKESLSKKRYAHIDFTLNIKYHKQILNTNIKTTQWFLSNKKLCFSNTRFYSTIQTFFHSNFFPDPYTYQHPILIWEEENVEPGKWHKMKQKSRFFLISKKKGSQPRQYRAWKTIQNDYLHSFVHGFKMGWSYCPELFRPIASYCPEPFRPITSYCPEPLLANNKLW